MPAVGRPVPLLKAVFDCEVLTPLFMAGMNQHDRRGTELRVPSLRGALRWWTRALLGARGVTDLKALQAEEAMIWGSAASDKGRGSTVRLHLSFPDGPVEAVAPSELPNWDKNRGQLRQNTGIGYLWFSIGLGDNQRSYIAPGTRFQVTFSTVATGRESEERRKAFEKALLAFWCVAHLGGLGTRSRRAAGSIAARLSAVSAEGDVQNLVPTFVPEGLPEVFDGVVKATLQKWMEGVDEPVGSLPSFATLHPEYCTIHRADYAGFERWEDLVEEAGTGLKEFRSAPDTRSQPDILRATFGLPLTLGKKPRTREIAASKGAEADASDRRASPVLLRAVRLGPRHYDLVAVHVRSSFLAEGATLTINGAKAQTPPRSLVTGYMKQEFGPGVHLYGRRND